MQAQQALAIELSLSVLRRKAITPDELPARNEEPLWRCSALAANVDNLSAHSICLGCVVVRVVQEHSATLDLQVWIEKSIRVRRLDRLVLGSRSRSLLRIPITFRKQLHAGVATDTFRDPFSLRPGPLLAAKFTPRRLVC